VNDYREFYRGRAVMITGGLGFIGSNLARRLVELGADVLLVDSLIPDYGGNLFNVDGIADRVRINVADIRQQSTMNYLVQDRDVIFSLAGQVSHIDSMRDPYTDLEINCRSQLSILEACRRNNPEMRIVFAGTRQIYGRPQYLPVDERHPLSPVDVNGINKTAGEWYHLLYGDVYGIPVTVLRLTNTYGPRMRVKDARQTFLGYWFRLVLEGEEIQVWGDGLQRRDFNYVDDAVRAFLLSAARDEAVGKIYNLGDDEIVSLKDLAELVVSVNGSGEFRVIPFPPERKAIDIGDYYGNHGRIRAELGWTPQVQLAEGIERSLAFYREHGSAYW
jgi:UDP-glucose 4-epimerase